MNVHYIIVIDLKNISRLHTEPQYIKEMRFLNLVTKPGKVKNVCANKCTLVIGKIN